MATGLTGGGQGPVTGPPILSGKGSPEGVVSAQVGALYRRTDAGEFYLKTSGTGKTGWVEFSDAIDAALDAANDYTDAAVAPVDGEIVQATSFPIPAGGPAGVIASTHNFGSAQGSLFSNFSFTPKYAGSWIRISYLFHAQHTGSTLGWYGFAVFSGTTRICQSWHYTTVNGAGATQGSSGIILQPTAVTMTLALRGGVGQTVSNVASIVNTGAIIIDEIHG